MSVLHWNVWIVSEAAWSTSGWSVNVNGIETGGELWHCRVAAVLCGGGVTLVHPLNCTQLHWSILLRRSETHHNKGAYVDSRLRFRCHIQLRDCIPKCFAALSLQLPTGCAGRFWD
ncbi:hypothetical protein E2C01_009030 [Portunus trituberculatus]|uniref:Uncharacterized protein n=1 Tax=Portunus trituberculatus TaxID=210409 RepID=A0A5B7D3K8_PORTR|nr:hypothetical protein [Portunus trituberculatus]